MKFEWEIINDNESGWVTTRAKVFGGWIVSETIMYEDSISSSLAFIPDSEHKWEIE